jgi:hypothetical protein
MSHRLPYFAAVLLCQASLLIAVGAERADQVAPAARPPDPAAAPAAASANPAAAPQDSIAPAPRAGKLNLKTHPSLVAVLPGHGGRQTLAIQYRWKVHENASVEVRLVPAERGEGTFVLPLDFVGQYLSSRDKPRSYDTGLQRKVYRCLDRAGDAGQTETFERDKLGFRIVGQRNSLGRPAVYVLAHNEGQPPEERADIVFLHLASWAVADDRLSLDLPPEIFAKRGKLFVWFLRGNRLLWEQQVPWPGAVAAK